MRSAKDARMCGYTHLLFDLDGTLTDPERGITNSVKFALSRFAIMESDREKLRMFIGPPLHISFMECYGFSREDAFRAVTHYREYFTARGIYENCLYEGIPDILAALQEKGEKIILATSKPTVYSERILKHFEIDHYFQDIVGSNLDGTMTDKGEIISHILMKHGIGPELALMIGDRKHDIIGARKNGVDSLAVGYGFGSPEELREAGPDFSCSGVRELRDFLLG